MNKFMSWLADSFAPSMNRLCSRPWIAAVSSAMQKIIPFILTGSIVYFYNVFRSYLSVLPDLGIIADYSFGLISMILAFVMAQQCMEKLNHPLYTTNAGLVSLAIFIMFIMPEKTEEGNMVLVQSRLGATGIAVGIVAGLFVSIIFHNYAKLKFLEGSTSIPDFVIGWINNIIPTILTLAIGMILVFKLHFNVFDAILLVFKPIASFGQTLPGFILCCLCPAILYTLGVSSWLFGAVTTPIFLAGIQANIDAVAAGGIATNIVTSEVCFTSALITMGGMGATLTLNILMIRSKSKKLKTLGKIFIGPSIFNINEPVMFGAPVVFNPLLMLPMWINSVTGPLVIWFAMRGGLLKIPAKLIQVGQIPAPFSSVMITEDLRAVLWYVVLFLIYLLTWYPFFKVYEKQVLAQEYGEQQ